MSIKIEYRVREVTRYIVTRFYQSESGYSGGSSQKGEFENPEMAYEVAYALCKDEHERLGYPPADERVKYPDPMILQGVVGWADANAESNCAAPLQDVKSSNRGVLYSGG